MISREMIDRINELSKKSREAGLTEEEKQEQQELRSKYIEYIKGQVKHQLDSIKFAEHKHDCSCVCKCKK
ncbi:MAG: DUF896 domain-containing protein [Gracilibacteraceae bacterium]|jgi:uncharacterized protein YnzC (UPF0291/DUF896 family)|nr:DUF896 domain-containing protein [Gracilibacteraceae bacterium]